MKISELQARGVTIVAEGAEVGCLPLCRQTEQGAGRRSDGPVGQPSKTQDISPNLHAYGTPASVMLYGARAGGHVVSRAFMNRPGVKSWR